MAGSFFGVLLRQARRNHRATAGPTRRRVTAEPTKLPISASSPKRSLDNVLSAADRGLKHEVHERPGPFGPNAGNSETSGLTS